MMEIAELRQQKGTGADAAANGKAENRNPRKKKGKISKWARKKRRRTQKVVDATVQFAKGNKAPKQPVDVEQSPDQV